MNILARMAAKPRARRIRKFTPGEPGREAGLRLEARALTVPTFYRLGDPAEILRSTVNGTNQPQVDQVGGAATLLYGNSTTQAFGQTNTVFTATSKIDTLDGGLSGTPSAPTSRDIVQVLTYSLLTADTPGFVPGLQNGMTTWETWDRVYTLADDTPSSSVSCTLVETMELNYSPSTSQFYQSGYQGTFSTTDITDPNASNHASTTVYFIGRVVINGDLMHGVEPGNTATFTTANANVYHGNSSIFVESGTNSAKVTISTSFPNGLPYIYSSPAPNNNTPTGVKWHVNAWMEHTLAGNSSAGASATTLDTNYTAKFTTP